jgi:trk system potassium uptake protein TrkA
MGKTRLRVAIAGAGNVGRSIASELIDNGHAVTLIEREPKAIKTASVPMATWVHADACELASLEKVGLEGFDVMVAATGDDKANLVVSLLAKTEFAVGRVVARVNHPKNEWLFDAGWGVDVAVSAPRLLTALVEEAVSVGDLVRLMRFQQGTASLVEITLPDDAPVVGYTIGSLDLPEGTAIVAVLRGGRVVIPGPDVGLEARDEVLALVSEVTLEPQLASVLGGPSATTSL